jgi:hypothetical protein
VISTPNTGAAKLLMIAATLPYRNNALNAADSDTGLIGIGHVLDSKE